MGEIRVGDKVLVNFEGTVIYASGDGYHEVKDDTGKRVSALKRYHLTKVVPPAPGVGAVVEINGKRWHNLGGSSKWTQVKRTDSFYSEPYMVYEVSGKTWAEIHQSGYKILANAL